MAEANELLDTGTDILETVSDGNIDLQTVIYGTTKWADIDFGKTLVLRYTVDGTVVCSAVYTFTDLVLKFYVNIEGEPYVVQLSNADAWSATKADSSSV